MYSICDFEKWHRCCPWASEIVADPIHLSRLSLSRPLSLLSGGEARWSLDDPQTDPRHQHESAWAAGESLHCECLFPLCTVLAGFSRCLRKQRGLHSATTGTGFNTFTRRDHIWIMKVLKAVLCHSGLFATWASLGESLLVNMLLELMLDDLLGGGANFVVRLSCALNFQWKHLS